MLFYVNDFNSGESDEITLTRITSDPNLNWQLRLPANELTVVGHVEGKLKLHPWGCFKPEDMIKFEPARQEALRQGVPLRDEWTR